MTDGRDWAGKFMTFEEIVADMIVGSEGKDQGASWREITRDQLIEAHHSTGRSTRNWYGLWHDGNPHVDVTNARSENHPDQLSMRVLEAVWDYFNKPRDLSDEDQAHNAAVRAHLFETFDRLVDSNFRALQAGQDKGSVSNEERAGVLTQGMIRGINRICELPDDRELTEDEKQLFGSGLVQVAVNALCLILELPMPEMNVVIAGFDTSTEKPN